MTPTTKRKIQEAIKACDRYIAIEDRRDPELRGVEVARTLAHAVTHRVKLLAMLEETN